MSFENDTTENESGSNGRVAINHTIKSSTEAIVSVNKRKKKLVSSSSASYNNGTGTSSSQHTPSLNNSLQIMDDSDSIEDTLESLNDDEDELNTNSNNNNNSDLIDEMEGDDEHCENLADDQVNSDDDDDDDEENLGIKQILLDAAGDPESSINIKTSTNLIKASNEWICSQNNASLNQDLIVCGTCQADFRITNFIEYIEHKIRNCSKGTSSKSSPSLLKSLKLNSKGGSGNNKSSLNLLTGGVASSKTRHKSENGDDEWHESTADEDETPTKRGNKYF